MAIKKIPVRSDVGPHEFDSTIDNKVYRFKFRYNTRANRWMFSVYTQQNAPVLQNIVMLANTHLTRQFNHLDIPKGVMFVIDSLSRQHSPERDDWNNRNYFLYDEVVS